MTGGPPPRSRRLWLGVSGRDARHPVGPAFRAGGADAEHPPGTSSLMAVLVSVCVACAVVTDAMMVEVGSWGLESQSRLVEEPVPAGSWAIPWGDTVAPPSAEQDRQTVALRRVTAATSALLTLLCLMIALGLWRQRLRLRRAEDRVHWAVGARRVQLVARLMGQSWHWAALAAAAAVTAAYGVPAVIDGTFPGRAAVPAGPLAATIVTVGVAVMVLRWEAGAGRRAARPVGRVSPVSSPTAVLAVGFAALTGVGLLARHAPGADAPTDGPVLAVAGVSLAAIPRGRRGPLSTEWLRPGGSLADPMRRVGVASAGITRGVGRTVDLWVDCGNCYEGGLPMRFKTVVAEVHAVASDTFPHLGLALLEGRDFDETTDRGVPDAVIVSRALAVRHFEGGEAVGRRLRVGDSGWLTVVGVVSDAADVRDHTEYVVYLPLTQAVPSELEIFAPAATSGDPEPLGPWIEAAPTDVQVAEVRGPVEIFSMHRWFARTMRILGVVAYLLVLAGVWLGSRNEARATIFELSVRRAVGATRGHTRMLFAGASGRRIAIALGAGAWLSLFLGAGLNAALGTIPQIDVGVWVRAGALVGAAYLAGAWPVFLRAARIPPAVGLTGTVPTGARRIGRAPTADGRVGRRRRSWSRGGPP